MPTMDNKFRLTLNKHIIVDLAAVLHHWVQASSLSKFILKLNLAAKLSSKLAPPPIYVSNIFLVLTEKLSWK